MSTIAEVGSGFLIEFLGTGYAAEVVSIEFSDIGARKLLDATHLQTPVAGAGQIGSREFIVAKHTDPGKIDLTCHLDADHVPPAQGSLESMRLTFPLRAGQATPTKWTFVGAVETSRIGVGVDEIMGLSFSAKLSGSITITPST